MTRLLTTLCLLLLSLPVAAQEPDEARPLKVIATVPTYGDLARTIGGELVEVVVLTRPGQDVHSVTATPSFMARVRGADLCLHTGLDAELWLDGLLRGSGNLDLLPGNPHSIALSDGVKLKEVPALVDRTQGDVHAYGNTHVWTDPIAVRGMAKRVRDALVSLLPDHEDELVERHATFHRSLTEALVRWLTEYRELKGRSVVVYHRSWPYFLDRFGIVQAGTLEPKPRVAPTASHLSALIDVMKEQHVDVVVREPYQHPEAAEHVAEATGATVLELSTHPGFPEGVDGIIEHFDYNLAQLAKVLLESDA